MTKNTRRSSYESDENSPGKQGSESAALQLLKLAGTKRSRDEMSTSTATEKKGDEQFEDADSEEEKDDGSQKEQKLSWVASQATTTQSTHKNRTPNAVDGQFDDADEPPEYNVPIHWTTAPSRRPQVQQQLTLQRSLAQFKTAHPPKAQPLSRRQGRTLPLMVPRLAVGLGVPPPMDVPPANLAPPANIVPRPPPSSSSSSSVAAGLVPIAPRVRPIPTRTFAQGPLTQHPHPLLEPDSNVPNALRGPPAPLVDPNPHIPVYQPLPTDILLGRGGGPARHAGNTWFRDFIQAYRGTYHRVDKYQKKQLAVNLTQYLRQCGGRFLEKRVVHGGVDVWYEVGDGRAWHKVSQALRESGGSGKKPKASSSFNNDSTADNSTQSRRPSASSTITSNPSYEAPDDHDSSVVLEV